MRSEGSLNVKLQVSKAVASEAAGENRLPRLLLLNAAEKEWEATKAAPKTVLQAELSSCKKYSSCYACVI